MDIVVGVADMKISDDPNATIVTHSLGSCIGLVIYDPTVKVGGMLHYMLPEPTSPDKAKSKPLMFANTGIPILFNKLGASKGSMGVKIAGGAQVLAASEHFMIGKRNDAAVRKILYKNNVLIRAGDIGGSMSRTMRLSIATGEVSVKAPGQGIKII